MPIPESPILLPSIPYVSSEDGVQIPPTTPSIFTGTSNPNGLQDAPLGSLFIDISENLIYIKKTAGVNGWKRSAGQMVFPTHASNTAGWTLTNQPNSEEFLLSTARCAFALDLSNFSQFRISVQIIAGSASPNSPRLYPRYANAYSLTASDYVNPLGANGDVNISLVTGSTLVVTPWTDLAEGAKGEIIVTLLMNGGDGVEDPSGAHTSWQFR